MKLANRASGFAGILLLLGTVHSVDIAQFPDQGCPLLDRDFYCPGQPERVCCEFGPTRLTATVSVEFVGLGEGDLATWFHGEDIGTVHNYCGGIRKRQVMKGNTPGALCMDIENDVLAESNEGANWRKSAKKNTKAKVLLASSKYGSVSSFLNGLKLVSPVGARGLPKDDSVETKCLATRHATIIGFDKRDNETGVWILTGNLESHERYADVKARHPTKSAAEILQLAGGTYHENWEDHPNARAVRRGEPAPTHELPSLMEMINSSELEKNKYTLALAAEELSKKSIDASTDHQQTAFLGSVNATPRTTRIPL